MSWHRAAARKVRGVGHAIASLVDQQGDQTAPKRCPESPVTPIRPAPPWRHLLSCAAIDAACAAPALPRARSESQKQNNGPNCNFFAIRDCCAAPDRGLRPENAGNQPQKGAIPALWGWKRVRNRKKVAEKPGFLFPHQENRRNEADPAKNMQNPSDEKDWRKTHGHSGGTNYA